MGFLDSCCCSRARCDELPDPLLHTLGSFGPSLAGIFMVCRMCGPAGRRNFWRRVVDFRLIGAGRTLLILAFIPMLTLISIELARLAGGSSHQFTNLLYPLSPPAALIHATVLLVCMVIIFKN
jgi:hypothetical protein